MLAPMILQKSASVHSCPYAFMKKIYIVNNIIDCIPINHDLPKFFCVILV